MFKPIRIVLTYSSVIQQTLSKAYGEIFIYRQDSFRY